MSITQTTKIALKPLSEAQVTEFQKIVKILNKYYNTLGSIPKSNSTLFRQKIVEAPASKLTISLSQNDKYTYTVQATYLQETYEWIHIDGIQEERDQFQEKEITDHPVFQITCLTDLYTDKV